MKYELKFPNVRAIIMLNFNIIIYIRIFRRDKEYAESVRDAYLAKEEYLKSAADYIKKNRGSVENFVNNALGIGCDITEQFRKEFLM